MDNSLGGEKDSTATSTPDDVPVARGRTGGWVKVYRCLLDHPRFTNGDWLKLWLWLLLKASHQPREVVFGAKRITLQPGQLITSRQRLSENTGIEVSKVERLLKVLQSEQQIEQRSSNASRLLTITGWGSYQRSEQPIDQPVNNGQTTDEQPMITNKKGKSLETDKDSSSKRGSEGAAGQSKPRKAKAENLPDLPPALEAQPDFLPVWTEFQTHRWELKHPLTPTSARRLLVTLAKRPTDAAAALDLAMDRNWRGFNWDWFDGARQPHRHQPYRHVNGTRHPSEPPTDAAAFMATILPP